MCGRNTVHGPKSCTAFHGLRDVDLLVIFWIIHLRMHWNMNLHKELIQAVTTGCRIGECTANDTFFRRCQLRSSLCSAACSASAGTRTAAVAVRSTEHLQLRLRGTHETAWSDTRECNGNNSRAQCIVEKVRHEEAICSGRAATCEALRRSM